MKKAPHLAILGLILAAAAFLRFWGLGRQGLWFDEARTAFFMHGSPGQILHALPRSESTPPLYYMVAWGWTRLFGDAEVGLRSLSAVAGLMTVLAAFAAGRTLATRRVGYVAAALVAVNPFLIWYSQEARAYALLVFLGALSFWLFARARTRRTTWALLWWALASALALCTHYFAAFLVVPEALMLLRTREIPLRSRLAAITAVGAVAVALVPIAYDERSHTPWIKHIPLRIRLGQIAHDFVAGFPPAAGPVALGLGGLAVLTALGLLAIRGDARERRAAGAAAVVGLLAIALPLLLALGGTDYLDARNVIAAVVPLTVLVAAGLGARRAGVIGLAALATATAMSVSVVFAVANHLAYQKLHWRQVSAALGPTRSPRAILLAPNTSVLSLEYYMPRTWWLPAAGARVDEIDVVRKLPGQPLCGWVWWGAACRYGGRAPLRRPPVKGFRLVSSRIVAGFEVARYRSPRPVRIFPAPPFGKRPAPGSRAPRRLLLSPRSRPLFP